MLRIRSRVGVGDFGNVGVGVGYFTSDSATLANTVCNISRKHQIYFATMKHKSRDGLPHYHFEPKIRVLPRKGVNDLAILI